MEPGEKTASSRWPMIRWLLIAGCIVALAPLILLSLPLLLSTCFWPRDTHIVLRNKTESTASEIVVHLQGPKPEATLRIEALAPGEERKLLIECRDFGVEVSLLLDSRKLEYQTVRVDLWAGETYALEFHPGDLLKHGYDPDRREGVIYIGSEPAKSGAP